MGMMGHQLHEEVEVLAEARYRSKLKPAEMIEKMGREWFISRNPDGTKNTTAGLTNKTKRDAVKRAEMMVVVWHAREGHPLPSDLDGYRPDYKLWADHYRNHGPDAEEARRIRDAKKKTRKELENAKRIVAEYAKGATNYHPDRGYYKDAAGGRLIIGKQIDILIREAETMVKNYEKHWGSAWADVWRKHRDSLLALKKKHA